MAYIPFLNNVYFAAKVGIGTETPGRKLTVEGEDNLAFFTSPANSYLTIDRGSTNRRNCLVFSTAGDGTSAIPNNINWALGSTDSDEISDGGTGFFIGAGGTGVSSAKLYIKNTGNVGIGTTTPNRLLEVAGTTRITDSFGIEIQALGAGPIITFGSTSDYDAFGSIGHQASQYQFVTQARPFNFLNGTTSQMFITAAGNVGIGTTEPQRKLTIFESSGNAVLQLANATSGVGSSDGFLIFTNGVDVGLENKENGYLSLATNASEKMRILATGQVGIGNSNPGDYATEANNLVVGSLSGNNGITILCTPSSGFGSIYFADSTTGNKVYSGFIRYQQNISDMTFGTNEVERMRLTLEGYLGIGTTNPLVKLDVASTSSQYVAKFSHSTGTGFAPGSILLEAGQSTSRGQGMYHYNTEADENWFTGVAYNVSSKKWIVANKNSVVQATDTAQLTHALMTIDSDTGNVGIGSTNPGDKLEVNGTVRAKAPATSDWAFIGYNSAGTASSGLWFDNGDGELLLRDDSNILNVRIRSDANSYFNGGNVGIGTTGPGAKLEVDGTINFNASGDKGFICSPGQGTFSLGDIDEVGGGAYLSTDSTNMNFYASGNNIARLTDAGTLTVTGDVVAYGSPSDERLKENIKPIKSALDKVMKLQGVTFDWKKTDSVLELKEDIGFIAQDVQKVVPELVRENTNGLLSMRHQGITPILLEAIKELKAEIEELKKQIK